MIAKVALHLSGKHAVATVSSSWSLEEITGNPLTFCHSDDEPLLGVQSIAVSSKRCSGVQRGWVLVQPISEHRI